MSGYATVGSGPSPRHAVPGGACDCHVHVYGPGYPVAPTAPVPPPVQATTTVLGRCTAARDRAHADRPALGLSTLVDNPAALYGF